MSKPQIQDKIITVVKSIFSQGTFEVETYNEGLLVELMRLNGTPIENIKSNYYENYDYTKDLSDEV